MNQSMLLVLLFCILVKGDLLGASIDNPPFQPLPTFPIGKLPTDSSCSYFCQNQKNYRLSGFSALSLLDQQNVPQNGKLSNKFTLSFQYACRQSTQFESCRGDFYWNNNLIKAISPSDYNIHNFSTTVVAEVGFNMFQMQGRGISDGFGLDIDNVKLVRFGTIENIVVNGDFQSTNVGGSIKIQNDIFGWKGTGIKVGNGILFNQQWKSQVCEIDGQYNCEMVQYFKFDINYNIVKNNQDSFR